MDSSTTSTSKNSKSVWKSQNESNKKFNLHPKSRNIDNVVTESAIPHKHPISGVRGAWM